MTRISIAKGAARKRNLYSSLQWQKTIAQLGRAMASKLSLDAVFREFAAGIKGHIPYDRLLISRVDPQNRIRRIFILSPGAKDTLDAPADLYGKGKSVTEWVVQERKPFVREDTALQREFETDERLHGLGLHSYISMPLIYWDRVVGSFHVACKRAGAYGERELAFLQSVAEWLAIAMENARFFQETHRLLEEQGVLHQVTSQIHILDLDSLLQRLTNELANIFKADSTFVRLREPDGSFRIRAASGTRIAEFRGAHRPSPRGRSSWIVENRRPLLIRDIRREDSSITAGTSLIRLGFRSYLGVPILLKDEAIGTLVVLSKSVKDFTDRDIFFLQQLAAEAAVAIHHALLFDELKRLNRDLERATLHKSQFLARLAHEFKTPLNVVTGILDIMNLGVTGPLSEKQISALGKIRDQSHALQKMVTDLLNLSRIEAGTIPVEVGTFSMAEIVESLRTLTDDLQRKNGLDVAWDIDPDLPTLTTDAGKVQAILQNLIVNAFKYTPEGQVKIRMRNRPQTKTVELTVEDTGMGISAGDLPKIFDGFHQVQSTAASQGVGLGLTIVKRYLELLKGAIRVDSKPGKGSTFTVTIPWSLEA
ncbi:MAG: GAF domain-containing sensor histidine kinase [Deltaproteobacteria bacterium]|nr:GAF domain-containing sensor histidine kinase [Deltaproteobacteria bacterium]MBI2539411.1 GAF domain-containing sensor histidine kinase [Deltaproteobacteria bacterium]